MSKRGEHEEKARRAIAAAQESGPLGVYLTRVFNGHTIHQRPSTGYIHATAMGKVKPSKKIAQWHMNKDTHAFLEALSATVGIPTIDLVESKAGGKEAGGGTWIHPEAAIHLAMWLDAHLAVQVIRWTSRFISGDLTLVHDLVDRHEAVHPGTQVRATVTVAGPEIDVDRVSELHQDNAVEQENQRLKVRIAEVLKNAETGEEELKAVRQERDGLIRALEEEQTAHMELQVSAAQMDRDLASLATEKTALETEKTTLETTTASLRKVLKRKRRRLAETTEQLSCTTLAGRALYRHYLTNRGNLEQLATAEELDGGGRGAPEQPLAGSKPTRYVALKNVTASSSGCGSKLICDLNRDTLDSIGQNLTRWGVATRPTRAEKFAAVSEILDFDFDSAPYATPYSSVSWRTVVYGVLKTKLALEYSTWASLQDVLALTTRSNAWFDRRRCALEFQLIQQQDLEALLGRTHRLEPPRRAAAAADAGDIRRWLLQTPAQLALTGPAEANDV